MKWTCARFERIISLHLYANLIAKFFLNLVKEGFLRDEFDVLGLGEVFDKFAFRFTEIFGDIDAEYDDEIAFAFAIAEFGHTVTFDGDFVAGLCTGFDGDTLCAVEGFDIEFAAQESLCNMNMSFGVEINPVAFDFFMVFDGDEDVEVAGGSTLCPGFAFAAQSESGAVIDAGGDFDRHGTFFVFETGTMAAFARFFDFFTLATTIWACGLNHEHHLAHLHLSTAVQGVFPPEAYGSIFIFIAIAALPGVISSFFVPETRQK